MILLSLIGEQPIPNLFPLWQSPQRYNATIFAYTVKTREVAENLKTCVEKDPRFQHIEVLPGIEMPPYDINRARNLILHKLTEGALREDIVCINLTGGTKVMSLAALQAAYGSGFPLLYVCTEMNQIIHYRSDGSEINREDLKINIYIKDYMNAYGLETSLHPDFNDLAGRPFEPPKEGDWLEKKVETLAVESRFFDDVQRKLHIRKRVGDLTRKNELDITAICNGKLVVCSCKTGSNWDKDDLYELLALSRREEAGIFCGKVFVTDEEPPDAIKARARIDRIRLVYGNKIERIAEVMLEAAGIKASDRQKEASR